VTSRAFAQRRAGGFTLVEVVVAFLLLSVVLTTVFEIFTSGMARAGELDNYSRALAIAQSELASAGVEETLAEGEVRGESDDRQFRWTVTVRRHEEPASPTSAAATGTQPAAQPIPYGLYRVDARVDWKSGAGTDRHVALSTLLLAQNR
jgi:general secretion pathway protein I